jgi:hypothetical protein
MNFKTSIQNKFYKWLEIPIKCKQAAMNKRILTKIKLLLTQLILFIEFFNVIKHN